MLGKIFLVAFLLGVVGAEYVPKNSAAYENDNNVLNFALTLEILEMTFYDQALQNFTAADFSDNEASINATFYNATFYQLLETIRSHERMHVAAINATLIARGATPVQRCVYNFGYTDVKSFLQVAAVLENTGVSAYDGAISSLTESDLKTYAATVSTVEARHASFLNLVTGQQPFNVSDTPLTPAEIIARASQFIVSCPPSKVSSLNLTLPVNADTFRNQTLVSAAANSSSSPAFQNDNNVLNFALALETLAATYYNLALANLSQADFANDGVNATYYDYITLIRDYENEHVAILKMLLSSRGATAVSNCTYNFDYSSVSVFLQTQALLQNTDVKAYDGAASAISDSSLLTAAATIATSEARYASFANFLIDQVPFPDVTDSALAPAVIVNLTSSFFKQCNFSFSSILPVPADTFRPNVTKNHASTSSAAPPASSTSSGQQTSTSGQQCTCPSTSTSGAQSSTSSSSTSGSNGNNGNGEDSGECPLSALEGTCASLSFNLGSNSLNFVDFDVVVFGDLTAASGDIEGNVAVQGDVVIGNGFGLDTQNEGVFALIAGSLSFGSGSIGGNVYCDGNVDVPSYLQSQIQNSSNGEDSDSWSATFSDAMDCYSGFQDQLSQQQDNVEFRVRWSAIEITCDGDEDQYSVTIDTDSMKRATLWTLINCSGSASWIININGTDDVSFHGASFPAQSENVIYNVLGQNRNIVVETAVNGDILAPGNFLNQSLGVVNGKVVCGGAFILQVNDIGCPSGSSGNGSSVQSASKNVAPTKNAGSLLAPSVFVALASVLFVLN